MSQILNNRPKITLNCLQPDLLGEDFYSLKQHPIPVCRYPVKIMPDVSGIRITVDLFVNVRPASLGIVATKVVCIVFFYLWVFTSGFQTVSTGCSIVIDRPMTSSSCVGSSTLFNSEYIFFFFFQKNR